MKSLPPEGMAVLVVVGAAFAAFAFLRDHKTYAECVDEVRERWGAGKFDCTVKRTWYGWRVDYRDMLRCRCCSSKDLVWVPEEITSLCISCMSWQEPIDKKSRNERKVLHSAINDTKGKDNGHNQRIDTTRKDKIPSILDTDDTGNG